MDDLEKVYEDKRNWSFFEGEDEGCTIGVYRKCPQCARLTKKGELFLNGFGEIKLKGWICKTHGEIEPYYDRDCYAEE